MDRSKWEYKKLGDVATFLNGYAFKPDNWSEHGLKIIRIQNLTDENALYNCYNGDIDPKYIVHKGDLLISWSATLGAFIWNNDDALLNQHIFKTIFDKSDIDKFYLRYCVISKLEEFSKKAHGITMRHITKKDFDNTIIPVPCIVDQQRIVAELDCLNEMIALKQEQLKEFDKLAQSIFYDMFGDPVHNEKGWDCSLFGECIKLRSGDGLSAKDIIPGEYPVYGGNGIVGYHNQFNLDEDAIIIGRVGALCGNVRNVKGCIFVTDNAFILSQLISFDNVFLKNLLEILNLRKFAREAMQPVISNKTLKDVNIILPPLALQQQFAEKIQAIEEQKELVKKSIAETQQLLDSRMDCYFD